MRQRSVTRRSVKQKPMEQKFHTTTRNLRKKLSHTRKRWMICAACSISTEVGICAIIGASALLKSLWLGGYYFGSIDQERFVKISQYVVREILRKIFQV